jgi:hypothetical protein
VMLYIHSIYTVASLSVSALAFIDHPCTLLQFLMRSSLCDCNMAGPMTLCSLVRCAHARSRPNRLSSDCGGVSHVSGVTKGVYLFQHMLRSGARREIRLKCSRCGAPQTFGPSSALRPSPCLAWDVSSHSPTKAMASTLFSSATSSFTTNSMLSAVKRTASHILSAPKEEYEEEYFSWDVEPTLVSHSANLSEYK